MLGLHLHDQFKLSDLISLDIHFLIRALPRIVFIFFIHNQVLANEATFSTRDSLLNIVASVDNDSLKLLKIFQFLEHADEEDEEFWYLKGKKIVQNNNNKTWEHKLDYHRGLNIRQVNTKEGILYFEELLLRIPEGGFLAATISLHLAELHHKIGNLNKSERALFDAKPIFFLSEKYDELAHVYYLQSLILRQRGFPDNGLSALDSALIYSDEGDISLLMSIYNNRGRIYRGMGDYDSAHHYYHTGYLIAMEHGPRTMEAKYLNNMGNVAHTRGRLDTALYYYNQSLEIKLEEKNERGATVAYHNIGAVHMDLKNFGKARKEFIRSRELAIKTNYKVLLIHNDIKIGKTFLEEGYPEKALPYHEDALRGAGGIGFESGRVNALINLASSKRTLDRPDEAIDHLLQAINIADKIEHKAYLSEALTGLALAYLSLNEQLDDEGGTRLVRDQDPQIEQLLIQGAQISQETGNYSGIESSLAALRKFYNQKKQHQRESEIADRYIRFRDSLFNQQSADAISKWETKFETAEKNRQIELLQKENELESLKNKANRNRLIAIGGSLLFILSLAFLRFYYKVKHRRLKHIEQLRNKISHDLHDEVGSLLTGLSMQSEILEMSSSSNDKKSLRRIHELSRSAMERIRDVVWAMDSSKDTGMALVDRMKDHAEVVMGGLDKFYKFDVELSKDHPLRPDVRQQVYMIYKEAVTNFLRHSNGDRIIIELSTNAKRLKMKIEDNGIVGNINTSGIGLTSIKKRAAAIEASLKIDYGRTGFQIYLEV